MTDEIQKIIVFDSFDLTEIQVNGDTIINMFIRIFNLSKILY